MNGNCVIYQKCSYQKCSYPKCSHQKCSYQKCSYLNCFYLKNIYIYILGRWFPGTNREGLLYPYTCKALWKNFTGDLNSAQRNPSALSCNPIRTIVTLSRLPQYYIIRRPLQATNTTTMNQLCSVSTLIMIFSRNLRSSHAWVDNVGLFYSCQSVHAQ